MSYAPVTSNEPLLKDHAITLLDVEIALQRRGHAFLAHMVSMARLAVEIEAGIIKPKGRTAK